MLQCTLPPPEGSTGVKVIPPSDPDRLRVSHLAVVAALSERALRPRGESARGGVTAAVGAFL